MSAYAIMYNSFTQTHMSMIALIRINHVFINHVAIYGLFHCICLKVSMLYYRYMHILITYVASCIARFNTLPYVLLILNVLSMLSHVKHLSTFYNQSFM